MIQTLTIVAATAGIVLTTSCEQKSGSEKAVEKIGDKIEDAADKFEDALD
ncbi:MAG: hypothetical protein ACKVJU_05505 [Verrucomicrobiales bacterium]